MSALVPRPIESAPRDHTIVRLLISFEGIDAFHPLEDETVAWTIGSNGFEHTEEDRWEFVGWNWSQDVFTHCIAPEQGKIVGWLPFHPEMETTTEGGA